MYRIESEIKFCLFVFLFFLSRFAAAQQYDWVFVCGRAESRSVETALYQTLSPV